MNSIVKAAVAEPEVQGLECPKCGCHHFEKTENPNVKSCRHCGRRVKYMFEGVDYVVMKCPNCRRPNPKIYSTRPPVRYHKCECGCNFKSVESSA